MAVLSTLLALAAAEAPAGAHPVLLAAEPGPGAVVAHPPGRVRLTFREPVESGRALVVVETARGRPLARGQVVSGSPAVVDARLPALGSGTYRVRYEVLGRDGHPVGGELRFAVWLAGAPRPDGLDDLAGREAHPLRARATVARAAAVALSLPLAGVLLASVVLGRRRPRRPPPWPRLVVAVGGAAMAADLVVLAGMGPRPLATSFGRLVAAHATLAAIAVVVARRGTGRAVTAGVAGLLLLTVTLTGHNLALAHHRVAAGLLDWAHVVAAALWIGGVAHLLTLPPGVDWRQEARRVAPFATAAAVVVVVTGSAAVRNRVPGAGALVDTAYGRTLLVKLALVAVVLALGGAVAGGVRRAVAAHGVRRALAARRALTGEAAGLAGVLAAVAVLVSLAPPVPTRPPSGVPLLTGALVGDQLLSVLVTPYRPGANTLHLAAVAGPGPAQASPPLASLVVGRSRRALPLDPAGWRAPLVLPPDGRARLRLEAAGQRRELALDAPAPAGTRLRTVVDLTGAQAEECRSRLVGQMVAVHEANLGSGRRFELAVSAPGPAQGGTPVGTCPGPPRGLGPLADPALAAPVFARYLAGHGVTRAALVTDGSQRASGFASAFVEAAAPLGMAVQGAGGGAEVVVVASGWAAARPAVAEAARPGSSPSRGVVLAPWLLEPRLLGSDREGGAQLTLGLTVDPFSAGARRYLNAVSALAPTELPSVEGLVGYLEARAGMSRAEGRPSQEAAARELATVLRPGRHPGEVQVQFFTPARVGFLPELLHPAHAAHLWLGEAGLAPVSGVLGARSEVGPRR